MDLEIGNQALMDYEAQSVASIELSKVAELTGKGLLPEEIAHKLGVSVHKVTYAINRLVDLSTRAGLIRAANRVVKQRVRLERLLPRTVKPILSAIEGYKSESVGDRKLAAETALALNKGLGVLKDHAEIEDRQRIDIFAQLRNDATLSMQLYRSFGIELPAGRCRPAPEPGPNTDQTAPTQDPIDPDHIDP